MSTVNYAVVRRHFCERYTTPPHAYFSGRIPITVYVVDERTIEINNETEEVTIDCMFPQNTKILKIKVSGNDQLLNHKLLTARRQQIDPEKLKWMNLGGHMNEVIYPVKVQLDREYHASERVQLTIEVMAAFRLIPEIKDFFLPCIEFMPVTSTKTDIKNWPKASNSADSSIAYVLPKGFKAVSMTSEGPDFISEFEGNSFVGWTFRGERYSYLRYWIAARISFLYFFLLYLIIPSSALLVIIADCLKAGVPQSIITMLGASYLVARYYLYDKTLMPPGGDLVLLTAFASLLLSVVSDFDLVLLMINLALVVLPWVAFYLRRHDTKRNRKRNDLRLAEKEKA